MGSEELFAQLSTFLGDLRNDGTGKYALVCFEDLYGTLDWQVLLDHLVENHSYAPPPPKTYKVAENRILDKEDNVGKNLA